MGCASQTNLPTQAYISACQLAVPTQIDSSLFRNDDENFQNRTHVRLILSKTGCIIQKLLNPIRGLGKHEVFRYASGRQVSKVRAGVAELADALDLGSSALRRMSSSLFARTSFFFGGYTGVLAGIAQLARASPCQGEGCEFESRFPLHFLCGCSSMVEP